MKQQMKTKSQRRYRVHPLRMFVAAILVAGLLVVPGTYLVQARTRGNVPEFTTISVAEGDTLWGIAAEHTEAGMDVRHVVESIQRLNGLQNAMIRPGQLLKVPTTR